MIIAGVLLAAATVTAPIPPENIGQPALPPTSGATVLAQRLVEAIAKDDPASVTDLFFPVEPFLVLKKIPRASDYHTKLVGWFVADIHREHNRIKQAATLLFRDWKPGHCVWKPIGSEYNQVAYWSCSKSRILADAGRQAVTIEVKTLINWGTDWFVTHLGPIPKEP